MKLLRYARGSVCCPARPFLLAALLSLLLAPTAQAQQDSRPAPNPGITPPNEARQRWERLRPPRPEDPGASLQGAAGPFTSCAEVTEIPQAECEALVVFYKNTHGETWANNVGWMETDTPCSWFGVSCANGHVTWLGLSNNQLGGTLPPELGNLPGLQYLILDANQITGSIPDELGNLTNLVGLGLSVNQLTGPIPASLGKLPNLQSLYLSNNQLTGAIPAQLGSLSSLTELDLSVNQLTGPIPASLGNLSTLRILALGENQLTGSLPPQLGQLSSLEWFSVASNQLSGIIPSELGSLSNLGLLDLGENFFTGDVPAQLGNLTNLHALYLQNNQLTGPIPLSFTSLSLEVFWFFSTGICEPPDGAFQNWLQAVYDVRGTEQTCPLLPYSCENVTAIPRTECEALEVFFTSTGGPNWNHNEGWMETTTPCFWYGVGCWNGHVASLDLPENNLHGSLPERIGDLPALRHLSLNANPQLSGPIPMQLTGLAELSTFYFGDTNLCEPQDSGFQAWLSGISSIERTYTTCGVETAGSFYLHAEPTYGTAPLTVYFAAGFTGEEGQGPDLVPVFSSWDFGDGRREEVVSQIEYPTAPWEHVRSHTYRQPGVYTVSVNLNYQAVLDTTIIVTGMPRAAFSYTCSGLTCTFDASASYDPDGGVLLSYDWTFGDDYTDSGRQVSHTFAAAGIYRITLTVTDDEEAQASTWQDISVNTGIPTRTVASDVVVMQVDDVVHLNPFGYYTGDPGRRIVFVLLNAGDSTIVNANVDTDGRLMLTGRGRGQTTVTATARYRDNQQAYAPDPVTFNVSVVAPAPPQAVFSYTCSGLACTFDASASYDPDGGTIQRYDWAFGDGHTGSGQQAGHTFAAAGTYDVALTVTDDEGEQATTRQNVTVQTAPPGIYYLAVDTTTGRAPLTVQFTAGYTGGGAGSPILTTVTSRWSFGDGEHTEITSEIDRTDTPWEHTVGHTYHQPGVYTVSVNLDDQAVLDTTITVTGLPEAVFSYTCSGLACTFDASASYDPDGGTIQRYDWAFGDGHTGSGQQAGHTFAAAGTYDVALTVTDDEGEQATTRQNVTLAQAAFDLFPADSLVFGEVYLGRQPERVVTIRNVGTATLNFAPAAASISLGHAFGFAEGQAALTPLPPGTTRDLVVRFIPGAEGRFVDTLTVVTLNAGTQRVLLTGTGTLPIVRHEPTQETSNTLPVTLTIPPDYHPTRAEIYARPGGSRAAMQRLGSLDDIAEGTVRGSVDLSLPLWEQMRGIEYYVLLSDDATQVTYPNVAAGEAPLYSPIHIEEALPFGLAFDRSSGLPLAPRRYRMISVPMVLDDPRAAAVLDEYGDYDDHAWRLWRWDGELGTEGDYREFTTREAYFTPGTAYWLITRDGATFSVEDARSTDATTPQFISLAPGWNQIGNPFAFPVAWDETRVNGRPVSEAAIEGPWEYVPEEDDYDVVPVLRPWTGYFVYNDTGAPATLEIPNREAPATGQQPGLIASALAQSDYALQLVAEVRGRNLRDAHNYVGLAASAAAERDALDFAEAPKIGDHLRLSIMEGRKALGGSFRPAGGEGQVWDLEIRVQVDEFIATPRRVEVSLRELGLRPEGQEVFVLDQDYGCPIPVTDQRFEVEVEGRRAVRRLRLILGSETFAVAHSDGIPLVPIEDALDQNYPNPFNPETVIRYQTSRRGPVRLDVFNALGQHVQTLVDRVENAGVHEVRWRPGQDGGRAVASGVYFLRMQTETFTATRQMLLLR